MWALSRLSFLLHPAASTACMESPRQPTALTSHQVHVFELDLAAAAALAVERRGKLVDHYAYAAEHDSRAPNREECGEAVEALVSGRISVAASGVPGHSAVSFRRSRSLQQATTFPDELPSEQETPGSGCKICSLCVAGLLEPHYAAVGEAGSELAGNMGKWPDARS